MLLALRLTPIFLWLLFAACVWHWRHERRALDRGRRSASSGLYIARQSRIVARAQMGVVFGLIAAVCWSAYIYLRF